LNKTLSLFLLLMVGIAVADWTGVGPAGGAIYAGAISPSDPSIVYFSTLTSPLNIVKSSDGGATWGFTSGQLSAYPFRMVVAGDNPDLVYAVMGSFYKTTNGGTSWSYLPAPSGCYFQDIEVNPQNSQEAFGTGYTNSGACHAAVARTTDGGESWSLFICDTATSYGYRVRVDPTDTSVVYCAGFRSGSNSIVYRSTDRGETWAALDMGVTGTSPYGLYICPLNPNIIVVGLYTSGMYLTTDGGATWSRTISMSSQYNLVGVPNQPQVLYASNATTVYRSDDTGRTWVQTGAGIGGKDAYLLMTTTASNSTVFCGTRAGMFKSTDYGATWEDATRNFACNKVGPIAVAGDRRTVFAECRDNAVFKSTDLGASWLRCPEFLSCGMICSFAILPAQADVVWALEGSG
jgi:photosystem II stability/assembly factor-like uncharacterized protein